MWPECLAINNQNTLVFGIGGGYDIYTCLPWYLQLPNESKNKCFLANYTFTDDIHVYTNEKYEYIAMINSNTNPTEKNKNYFPEYHLAKQLNKTIYTIHLVPCPILINVIEQFVIDNNIKKILMFDGGTDSIVFGNENRIYGSPLEDSQTILACTLVANKLNLSCILITSALNIDDCNIVHYTNNWNIMTKLGYTFDKIKVGPHISSWKEYKEIVQTSDPPSIIQESIIAIGEKNLGIYINPRLFPVRIEDKNDLPELLQDTAIYWFWNANELIKLFPFYQYLIKCLNDMYECDKNWIYWDQNINLFFNQM